MLIRCRYTYALIYLDGSQRIVSRKRYAKTLNQAQRDAVHVIHNDSISIINPTNLSCHKLRILPDPKLRTGETLSLSLFLYSTHVYARVYLLNSCD